VVTDTEMHEVVARRGPFLETSRVRDILHAAILSLSERYVPAMRPGDGKAATHHAEVQP
jgi:hypothetical protein